MTEADLSAHAITEDGESTEKWAFRQPEFMGTIKQLVKCARCGEFIKMPPDAPSHCRDLLKPSMHFLCDECYEGLP